jgi:hypothetical protein
VSSGSFPIVLAPPRAGNLIAAIVITLAGLGFIWCAFIAGLFVHFGIVLLILGIPTAIYGAVMAPLSLRLRLILDANQAIVRGYFGTRRVPRGAITGITAWPSIVWSDARGQRRKTVVNALNLYRSGFYYQPRQSGVEAADARIDVLRDWALSDLSDTGF